MIMGGIQINGVGVGVFVKSVKPPGGRNIKNVGVGVGELATGAIEVFVGIGVGGPAIMARVLGIQAGVVIVTEIQA